MEYISIYGETIKGKIVSELENTVVVEDKKVFDTLFTKIALIQNVKSRILIY
ncbi:hypothetical protein [Enterococcus thailandicus]|uniref:hypothetical protein n=1 Tax=Enterococcus thailandicus TaxID=417368 RepID=UPI0022E3D857|nr:hypothetical protein [Enterococcus thailandicus]